MKAWNELTYYAGLDWAGDHHDVVIVDRVGVVVAQFRFAHSAAGWTEFRQTIQTYLPLGDRGLGSYPVMAWLKSLGVDVVGRTTRHVDGRRRCQRLGRNDRLLHWIKTPSCASPWLSALQRMTLPSHMVLRAVKGSCYQKGFRVRQVTLITTLLDPQLYPAQQILRAYVRRWRIEMCLDDFKTTLHMDFLRSRTPEMIQKELFARLIAHNLVRCTMAQAAGWLANGSKPNNVSCCAAG